MVNPEMEIARETLSGFIILRSAFLLPYDREEA
jgi:hypothetical protein